MSTMPANLDPEGGVEQCSIAGLGKCIVRTAQETMWDGQNGAFTRHWFRMSYIGRACYREHGPVTGYLIETLLAVPHYTAMALGNGAAGLSAPFVNPGPPPRVLRNRNPPATKQPARHSASEDRRSAAGAVLAPRRVRGHGRAHVATQSPQQ